jgi:hypothetical protein
MTLTAAGYMQQMHVTAQNIPVTKGLTPLKVIYAVIFNPHPGETTKTQL